MRKHHNIGANSMQTVSVYSNEEISLRLSLQFSIYTQNLQSPHTYQLHSYTYTNTTCPLKRLSRIATTEVGAKDEVHARLRAANALHLQGTGPIVAVPAAVTVITSV